MRKTPLSFDSRVDSFNTDRGSELRPDHKEQKKKEACTRKHEKRPEARVRRHDQPPNPPQEVNNGQVQDVIMSVVICDSVVHLSISGPHECDSQHPSSS